MISDDPTAELSSYRLLAMWRNLYYIHNNDPSHDLYLKVCNRFCAMGYSLGGNASINMSIFRLPTDGMRCIIALHPAPTEKQKAPLVDLPMLGGNSTKLVSERVCLVLRM